MAHYFLSPAIHIATVQDSVVLLDTKRNRYFALDPEQALALRIAIQEEHVAPKERNSLTQDDCDSFVHMLLSKGFVTEQQPGQMSPDRNRHPEEPIQSLAPSPFDAPPRVRLGNWIMLAVACIWSATFLYGGSLCVTESRLRRGNSQDIRDLTREDLVELQSFIRIFFRIRPFFYTANRKCLYDSLVLVRFLRLYGFRPTLVIGVQLQPFCAHSWAQLSDKVLNDDVQRVATFRPILAA